MQLEKFSKIKHEIINNLIVAKLRIKSTRPTIIQGRHFRGWGRGGLMLLLGAVLFGLLFSASARS